MNYSALQKMTHTSLQALLPVPMFAFLPADFLELRSPVLIPVWLRVEFVLCICRISSLLLFRLFRLVFPFDPINGDAPTLGPTCIFSNLVVALEDEGANCIDTWLREC